jgi:hypothetical protein
VAAPAPGVASVCEDNVVPGCAEEGLSYMPLVPAENKGRAGALCVVAPPCVQGSVPCLGPTDEMGVGEVPPPSSVGTLSGGAVTIEPVVPVSTGTLVELVPSGRATTSVVRRGLRRRGWYRQREHLQCHARIRQPSGRPELERPARLAFPTLHPQDTSHIPLST